jgi:hypothetical protein
MSKEREITAGKYILIEVPSFNDSESEPMASYLRLGAVKDVSIAGKTTAPKESGEDLAGLVTDFVDDTRKRDGCDSTGEFTFIPEAERLAESKLLHTKGGWRDHSDGNRITTTRGDKVEVIRGNYKLMVLGRTDNPDEAASIDLSGGHIGEDSITFRGGNYASIEWVQSYDGTWKVVEDVLRGDVTSTYHGDVRDYYYGLIVESTTGSEAPATYKENPRITEKTWATLIESYTGSAALPVPTIKDETWATAIESTTNAETITDATTATSITSTTTVTGAITDTTTATSVTSTTTADVSDTTTGDVTSVTTGDVSDTTIGDSTSIIIGTDTEMIVGNVMELTVGAEESIKIGASVDISLGATLSLALQGGVEIDIGPKVSLTMFHADISTYCAEYKTVKEAYSAAQNKVSGAINYMAGIIRLG